MDEEDWRAVRADPRRTKDPGAFFLESFQRLIDVLGFETDMMLSARRILLEELHDRRILAERLEQLDLRIWSVDKADSNALDGKLERLAVRLGPEHAAIELNALLNRRRCDADMI